MGCAFSWMWVSSLSPSSLRVSRLRWVWNNHGYCTTFRHKKSYRRSYQLETREQDVVPLAHENTPHRCSKTWHLMMILKVHGTERGGSLWPSRSHHQRDTPTLSTTSILEKFLNPSLSLLSRGSLAICSEYASFASPNLPRSCSNTAFGRYLCQVASRLFWNKLNFLAVVFLSFPPGACRKAYSNVRSRGISGLWQIRTSTCYFKRGDSDSELETSAKMENVSWGAGFFFKPPMNAQALTHSDGLDIRRLQKQQRASKMRVWMGLYGWMRVDGCVNFQHVCTLS